MLKFATTKLRKTTVNGFVVIRMEGIEPEHEMPVKGVRIIIPEVGLHVFTHGPDGYTLAPLLYSDVEDQDIDVEEYRIALHAAMAAVAERAAKLVQIARAAGCHCDDITHIHGPLDTESVTKH